MVSGCVVYLTTSFSFLQKNQQILTAQSFSCARGNRAFSDLMGKV
jgi:hypothetical protein